MEEKKIYDWSSKHVLIVEDDILNFELIKELLSENMIKITHATTGLEAVRFCRKENTFDVVLMDMRLPELDGYQATKKIKEFLPNLTVIANTAHALTEDKEKCLSAGCNYYLTKPVNKKLLFETIQDVFNKQM